MIQSEVSKDMSIVYFILLFAFFFLIIFFILLLLVVVFTYLAFCCFCILLIFFSFFSSTGRRPEELMSWRGSRASVLKCVCSSVRPSIRYVFLVNAIKSSFLFDSVETCTGWFYYYKD